MAEKLVETDIIIVGAGPAGLALANYLGLYGIGAAVIERNQGTVDEPRAVSIDDESLRSMQTLGLVEDIIPRTLPGYGARYYTPGQREFARVKPTTLEFGHPRRSAFHQPELEATLLKGLSRFPKIQILFGHNFEKLFQEGDKVEAVVSEPGGEKIKISGQFLAGCDGGRSSVRQAIGSQLVGSSFEERWLVLDTINDFDHTPDSVAHCDHRRPAITLPGFGGTRRWEFVVHPGENADDFLKEPKIKELLHPYIGDKPIEVVRRVVYTFQARVADSWQNGRVFLLGDAAHLTPPYAGQGLNSGQRDAANFAWKVAKVVKGQFNSALMNSYQLERKEHAWALIKMAIQIGWVMVPRNFFHTYGQAIFFRLAGFIPRFRDYIMGLKFKPVPRFTEGFLCPDGLSNKKTLVGRMLPQPLLAGVDEKPIRLDEQLGIDFSFLWVCPESRDPFGGLSLGNFGLPEAKKVILPESSATHIAFRPYKGKILLIRPDRYVAAAFDPNDFEAQRKICQMLAGYI
jgi:3-(3-hydroxy-phenyl)propionate hydroxylase